MTMLQVNESLTCAGAVITSSSQSVLLSTPWIRNIYWRVTLLYVQVGNPINRSCFTGEFSHVEPHMFHIQGMGEVPGTNSLPYFLVW